MGKLELVKKSFDWLGKILSYRFQYSAKDDNSEFSLPSIVPYAKVKVKLLFWGTGQTLTSENSELSLPSNFMCH